MNVLITILIVIVAMLIKPN